MDVAHFGGRMEDGGEMETSRQIRVRFVTELPPPLRVPKTSIAVPSNFTRMGLSEIVNTLLSGSTHLPIKLFEQLVCEFLFDF